MTDGNNKHLLLRFIHIEDDAINIGLFSTKQVPQRRALLLALSGRRRSERIDSSKP